MDVNDLKEKIFEQGRVLPSSKKMCSQRHCRKFEIGLSRNNMGPSYVLEKVVYSYDGYHFKVLWMSMEI